MTVRKTYTDSDSDKCDSQGQEEGSDGNEEDKDVLGSEDWSTGRDLLLQPLVS